MERPPFCAAQRPASSPNLGFAEDRSSELQREVTILRQQVASYEASEHEAQLLEEVQRSVSRESSAGGTIAAKMKGVSKVSKTQCSMLGLPTFASMLMNKECMDLSLGHAFAAMQMISVSCQNKKLPKILFETKFVGTYRSLFQACFVGECFSQPTSLITYRER